MTTGPLRGVPWPPLLSTTAAGAALLGLAATSPRGWLGLHLLGVAVALVAAAAAFALDEPAAEVVDATPYSLQRRNLTRTAVVALPVGLSTVLLGLTWLGRSPATFWRLGLQLVGVVVVGLAVTAAARRGRPTPGDLVGSVVALAVVGLTVYDPLARWVPILPLTTDWHPGRTAAVWCGAICVGVLVLVHAGRDRLDG